MGISAISPWDVKGVRFCDLLKGDLFVTLDEDDGVDGVCMKVGWVDNAEDLTNAVEITTGDLCAFLGNEKVVRVEQVNTLQVKEKV